MRTNGKNTFLQEDFSPLGEGFERLGGVWEPPPHLNPKGGGFHQRRTIYLKKKHRIDKIMKRVVITGMGIYSCIGKNLDEVKDSLYNGKSGIGIDPVRKELGYFLH